MEDYGKARNYGGTGRHAYCFEYTDSATKAVKKVIVVGETDTAEQYLLENFDVAKINSMPYATDAEIESGIKNGVKSVKTVFGIHLPICDAW